MEIVRRVRERDLRYPILILTARSDWQDKVEALEIGADDYVTKPFRIEELMARVNALLRRSAGHAAPEVRNGPLKVNLSSQEVSIDDEPMELTTFEYKVLEYFMLHPGQVVSKMELNEHLYDEDADPDSNVIEVIIGRLRRKLDPGGEWQPIETLRGRGYRFRRDAD
jgi:two-component system response regulator PhoP